MYQVHASCSSRLCVCAETLPPNRSDELRRYFPIAEATARNGGEGDGLTTTVDCLLLHLTSHPFLICLELCTPRPP